MVNMSDEEKAAAFDKLALCFDYPNFGACSKSDIELCYFSIILDYLIDHKIPYDDYSMSKMFGITQQRVRNLKVKKQLRYRRDYSWEEALISRVKNARYSNDSGTITISIDDPNLYIEVAHFIEIKGYQYDCSLNPKLMKMETAAFACLLLEIGKIDEESDAWKELQKKFREEQDAITKITKETMVKSLKDGAVSFVKDKLPDLVSSIVAAMICKQIGI